MATAFVVSVFLPFVLSMSETDLFGLSTLALWVVTVWGLESSFY